MRDIFSKTLVRMTALYVLILAVVCLGFSGFIYRIASNEIDRTSRRQIVGFRNMFGKILLDEQQSEDLRSVESEAARTRLGGDLLLVNFLVISSGTFLCYYLAKRTLHPIEQSMKSQERFTSDASHELRTPLASMRTEIEVAMRAPKLSIVEAKDLLASNLEEVLTLQTMTDNLLSLARNNELGEYKKVDVSRSLKATLKKYETLFRHAKMTLSSDIQRVVMTTNTEAINQALRILLDNSLKYAGAGTECNVSFIQESQDSVVLTISDNGAGIEQSKLANIFDRFYKTDMSRTGSRASGHGLGLAIAKQLVGALKGSIEAKERDGGGLEFRIVLSLV